MTPIKEVGTDETMAYQACSRKMKTGRLEGSKLPFSNPLPKEVKSAEFLNHLVIGALLEPNISDEFRNLKSLDRKIDEEFVPLGEKYLKKVEIDPECGEDSPLMAYKARPLEGIWATAPYLHNGSVKNLYQLLLPYEKRNKTFVVSRNEFDPKYVGFKENSETKSFVFDTSIPGNSNKGHDTYGNDEFSDEQRWQLVEYLKTL
jgi:hypothetical protein